MDIHKFTLNKIFDRNAKEYQTKPILAAKYQPGMQTGFMVYFCSKADNKRNLMQYESVKFFRTESDAWEYIYADHEQYIMKNGKMIALMADYDEPKPVLHRKYDSAKIEDETGFDFENTFLSDESKLYECYVLDENSWIIQEPDGNIRVWYPDSEETFFGEEYIYEKNYHGNRCDYVLAMV